jgi:hypothetical protein
MMFQFQNKLKETFIQLDTDKDGTLTRQQFHVLCRSLSLALSPLEKNVLLAGNRTTLEELIQFLREKDGLVLIGDNVATEAKKVLFVYFTLNVCLFFVLLDNQWRFISLPSGQMADWWTGRLID